MQNEFDLFETFPDHSLVWRSCVRGTEPALAKLEAISKLTTNECFAIHIDTKTIIGKVQASSTAG
jgi:hypothetical protein